MVELALLWFGLLWSAWIGFRNLPPIIMVWNTVDAEQRTNLCALILVTLVSVMFVGTWNVTSVRLPSLRNSHIPFPAI